MFEPVFAQFESNLGRNLNEEKMHYLKIWGIERGKNEKYRDVGEYI